MKNNNKNLIKNAKIEKLIIEKETINNPKLHTTSSIQVIEKKANPFILMVCLVMSVMFFGFACWIFTGCGNDTTIITNERYVVVPYSEDSNTQSIYNPSNEAQTLSANNLNSAGIAESNSYEEVEGQPALLQQWEDGGYTYSQFYLGYVRNVPIDHQTANKYDGENDLKITFTKTICTQEAVEESLTTCEEVTKTTSHTVSAGVTVTGETKASFLGAGGKMSVAVSAGWQGTWEDSTAVSTSDTYTTAKSFSEEKSYSAEYTINTHKEGFYRYTLFATTDVYCVARTTNATSYEIDYAFCARPETYFYALDYSETNDFKKSSTDDIKIELKASDVANLQLLKPETQPLNKSLITTCTYDSSTDDKMKDRTRYGDDDNYYGMNTAYDDSDKLDMSAYSAYFNKGYVFEFNFKLYMNIENDGNQEFYLYNKATKGQETKDKMKRSEATSKGLIAEKLFNYKKGDTPEPAFAFRVPGNVVKNTMFTKFGANGDGEDKWKISKLTCTTKIYKTEIKGIYDDQKGKEITDNGGWGISNTSTADKLDLSKYSSFLNENNSFILMFAIKMHEKDDGSQEVYLYTNNTKNSGSSKDDAVKAGYVSTVARVNPDNADFDFNRTDGTDGTDAWVYFSVYINGASLQNTMYLRYDANGKDGDTWVIKNVNLYITAIEK